MHTLAWRTLGSLAAATWIYLAFFRGFFWKLNRRLEPGTPSSRPLSITAVIPARNESDVIATTVASLRSQLTSPPIRITVVDDESSDGTAERARTAGATQVLSAGPRPPGWKGKLWAVHCGVRALDQTPDYLLLTDADIFYREDAVAALVAKAGEGFDLVSVMVRLQTQSFAERLLIPAFVFFFFKLYPLAWVSDPNKSTAAAAGGVMLIRPDALARSGGIESIRASLIDDCALARNVKASEGKIWLGTSSIPIRSTRGYGSWGGIRQMIARSAFDQLNHSTLLLFGTLCGLALTYVAPLALVLSGDPVSAGLGAAVWLTSALLFAPTVREYEVPRWISFCLPAIGIFYGVATIDSALRYWRGRGGEWKGRVQDAR